MVIDNLLLVLEDLAVEFVGQTVDGGVHVSVDAFDMNVLAANVHGGLDLMFQLVHGQDNVDVDDVVEMT